MLTMLLAEELIKDRLRETERHGLAVSVMSEGRLCRWVRQRIGSSNNKRLNDHLTWTMQTQDLEEDEFGWCID
jgi:hypothetical protein